MALIWLSAILAYTTAADGQSPSARAASPAPAATPPPRQVQIDRNSVLILVRGALMALQQANQTGNYSVLRGLGSPGFQKANSPERLAQSFANLRAKNFDLSGVLVLDPQFTILPEIFSNGVMRMAGFFPSVPMQVYFEVQFEPVQGQWRLVAMAVDVGGSTPAAPTPNPALASSYPTATATATPTPSPTPARAAAESSPKATGGVEVRPTKRATATPKPRSQIATPRQ